MLETYKTTSYPSYYAKKYNDHDDESYRLFVEEYQPPKKRERKKPPKERKAFCADLEKLYEVLGVRGLRKQTQD